MQEIADISEKDAASLTICGANALDSEGNPADEIIADTNNPKSPTRRIRRGSPFYLFIFLRFSCIMKP